MVKLIIIACLHMALDCMIAEYNFGNFLECRRSSAIERERLVKTFDYSGVYVEYWEVYCDGY